HGASGRAVHRTASPSSARKETVCARGTLPRAEMNDSERRDSKSPPEAPAPDLAESAAIARAASMRPFLVPATGEAEARIARRTSSSVAWGRADQRSAARPLTC